MYNLISKLIKELVSNYGVKVIKMVKKSIFLLNVF